MKKMKMKSTYQSMLSFGRNPSRIPQENAWAKAPGSVFELSALINFIKGFSIMAKL